MLRIGEGEGRLRTERVWGPRMEGGEDGGREAGMEGPREEAQSQGPGRQETGQAIQSCAPYRGRTSGIRSTGQSQALRSPGRVSGRPLPWGAEAPPTTVIKINNVISTRGKKKEKETSLQHASFKYRNT